MSKLKNIRFLNFSIIVVIVGLVFTAAMSGQQIASLSSFYADHQIVASTSIIQ